MHDNKMRERILDAALKCCKDKDYRKITRLEIARAVGCTQSLVSYYLGNREEIQAHIMQWAIHCKDIDVLLRGLLDKNYIATAAPVALKRKAIALWKQYLNK